MRSSVMMISSMYVSSMYVSSMMVSSYTLSPALACAAAGAAIIAASMKAVMNFGYICIALHRKDRDELSFEHEACALASEGVAGDQCETRALFGRHIDARVVGISLGERDDGVEVTHTICFERDGVSRFKLGDAIECLVHLIVHHREVRGVRKYDHIAALAELGAVHIAGRTILEKLVEDGDVARIRILHREVEIDGGDDDALGIDGADLDGRCFGIRERRKRSELWEIRERDVVLDMSAVDIIRYKADGIRRGERKKKYHGCRSQEYSLWGLLGRGRFHRYIVLLLPHFVKGVLDKRSLPSDDSLMHSAHPTPPHHHHHDDSHDEGSRGVRWIVNLLTIAGLIILIVVVIWGLLHLASLSGSWFSSFFGGSNSAIAVHAPESARSGTPFTINWEYEADDDGVYAIQYACADGLQIAAPAEEGRFQPIPCGASLVVGSATNAAFLPVLSGLSGDTAATAAFSVVYLRAGSEERIAEGAAIVTILPGEAPAVEEPDEEAPVAPVESGTADLTVVITSAQVDPGGNAVVTFNISNAGSGTSDVYSFTAQLPTAQPYTYVSSAQTPLSPGSYVVNTIRFSQAISGTVMVSVSGDGSVHNNTASHFLNAPYTQGYPYPY